MGLETNDTRLEAFTNTFQPPSPVISKGNMGLHATVEKLNPNVQMCSFAMNKCAKMYSNF